MRRAPSLSLASMALLGLALAGCGGEGTSSSPTSSSASSSSASSTSSSASASSSSASSSAAAPSSSASASPSSSQSSAASESGRSERGNLKKAIGQPALIKGESGNAAVTLTVTGIEPAAQCSSEYADSPENGRFVKINVDIATGSSKDMDSVLYDDHFYFTPYEWKFIGADGKRQNDPATGGSQMCLDQSEVVPSEMGPGEKTSGSIVLDVPNGPGELIYTQPQIDDGWEWQVK